MKLVAVFILVVFHIVGFSQAPVDSALKASMRDTLAKNPVLFLKVASKQMKWEEPATPRHIAGPIYFVGTIGLASYLITTTQGNILLYTGLPSSGPMIEKSIRALGFKPEDIKILITGHAHIDHVGAFAYFKKLSGAQVEIMDAEKELIESGGKTDFHYGQYSQFQFEPVKVDRVLHDHDTVTLGGVGMTALFTPGHTQGGTTWVMNVIDNGKSYKVVFPDGMSINPGYRVEVHPSYPGIRENYEKTIEILSSLHPDIWLPSHTDFFDFDAKSKRVMPNGENPFADPKGYEKYIASARATLDAEIETETAQDKQQ